LRDGHGTVEAPVQPCSRWPRPDSEAGLRAASV
jgi:hypothetical protein